MTLMIRYNYLLVLLIIGLCITLFKVNTAAGQTPSPAITPYPSALISSFGKCIPENDLDDRFVNAILERLDLQDTAAYLNIRIPPEEFLARWFRIFSDSKVYMGGTEGIKRVQQLISPEILERLSKTLGSMVDMRKNLNKPLEACIKTAFSLEELIYIQIDLAREWSLMRKAQIDRRANWLKIQTLQREYEEIRKDSRKAQESLDNSLENFLRQ
ncbi:MAG: hypothetical protein HQL69_02600 [Magnetococcales bacterium]|nr:hypothetical protein [Magnetococcales bacterium]